MLSRTTASPIVLSSGQQRMAMAGGSYFGLNESGVMPAADTNNETNLKTPDYHLPFTGIQVEDALWKIIRLDLHDTGGIKILESSPEAPSNLDTLLDGGNYVTDYAQAATFPDEFVGLKPLNIHVTEKDNGDGSRSVIQILEAGGNRYYRWTKDEGTTWSAFPPKPTNSGPIDMSGDPTAPPGKDPITIINETLNTYGDRLDDIDEDITLINKKLLSSLRVGESSVALQILAGTFDYDTVIPNPDLAEAEKPAS